MGTYIKRALGSRVPEQLKSDTELRVLTQNGYVLSHGWVTVKGQGLAFGKTPIPSELDATNPGLLLYKPLRTLTDEELSDDEADYPYQLMAVGYFTGYGADGEIDTPPRAPPPTALDFVPPGVFPTGAWFRHAAGCHVSTGWFVPFRENLPAPEHPLLVRTAWGTAWCKDIGALSRWEVPADTEVEPGVQGHCVLSRRTEVKVGVARRPVVPGTRMPLKAPRADHRPMQKEGEDPAAYKARLDAWRQSIAKAAHSACQTLGIRGYSNNFPSFWHEMVWDTHAFFEPDGNVWIGMIDLEQVPHGGEFPAGSFEPVNTARFPVKGRIKDGRYVPPTP